MVWLLAPVHLRKAIINGHANIDDYKLFENRVVENAESIPWQLDSLYNQYKIDSARLAVFELYGTTAYVVIKDKKIVHEKYWDGGSDTTRSNSFSVSKSIISLLIGCLVDEGKIKSLEQSITDFLPEFKNTNGFTLKVRDLLTMSSGIEWNEGYSSLFSVTTEAYYGNNLKELVLDLNVKSEPGKIFSYQSCNTQLLGLIIETLSGKTISAYAAEKLWKPLGAEHPALWSIDSENGIEKAYCCFNSTATDFARIGQMVLDSGQFNNRQIISKQYISQATSPATWLKGADNVSCYYYGYQFWMTPYKGENIVYARGILGQYIIIVPSKNAVIVRLGTDRAKDFLNYAPNDFYTYLDTAFEMLDK